MKAHKENDARVAIAKKAKATLAAAHAERQLEAAHVQVKAAKQTLKQTRKDLKNAKKTAKSARKELKAANRAVKTLPRSIRTRVAKTPPGKPKVKAPPATEGSLAST